MSGRHARDGRRRDGTAARARDTWTRLRKLATLEFHLDFWLAPWGPDWWDWEWVQAHWYRQFRRADRKAFRAECEEIRARATMTPVPGRHPGQGTAPDSGPGRQARPGDHPLETGLARGVVRAGAGPDEPVPYWPAYLPTPAPDRSPAQVPRPVDPRDRSSRGAVRAGATIPAPGAAPGQAPHAPAALPPEQPDAALSPVSAAPLPRPAPAAFPGAGQHPDGQPVVWNRPDGSQVIIGYGPTAQIPKPYAQARVTGAHVIIPGPAPLVPRGYQAFEARRDSAVNTP